MERPRVPLDDQMGHAADVVIGIHRQLLEDLGIDSDTLKADRLQHALVAAYTLGLTAGVRAAGAEPDLDEPEDDITDPRSPR